MNLNLINNKVENLIENYLHKEGFYESHERPITRLWIPLGLVRGIVFIALLFLFAKETHIRDSLAESSTFYAIYLVLQLFIYSLIKVTAFKLWMKQQFIKIFPVVAQKLRCDYFLFRVQSIIDIFFYFFVIFRTDQAYYDTYLLLFIPIFMMTVYLRNLKGIFLTAFLAFLYFSYCLFMVASDDLLLLLFRSGFLIFIGIIFGGFHFLLDRMFRRKELELKFANTFNINGTDVEVADEICKIIVNNISPEDRDRICAGIFATYKWGKLRLKGVEGISRPNTETNQFDFGEGLTGKAAETKRRVTSDDLKSDPGAEFKFEPYFTKQYERIAFIAIPLLDQKDNLIGVLTVAKYYNGERQDYKHVFGSSFLNKLNKLTKTISIYYNNAVLSLLRRRNEYIYELSMKIDDAVDIAVRENQSATELIYRIGNILKAEINADEVLLYEYEDKLRSLILKGQHHRHNFSIIFDQQHPLYQYLITSLDEKDIAKIENEQIFPDKYESLTLMPLWEQAGKLNALFVFLREKSTQQSAHQGTPGKHNGSILDELLISPDWLLRKIYWKVLALYKNSMLQEAVLIRNRQLDNILDQMHNTFSNLNKQEDVLLKASQLAIEIFKSEGCTIYLLNDRKNQLVLKKAIGFKNSEMMVGNFYFDVTNTDENPGLPVHIFHHPDSPLVAHTANEFEDLKPLSRRLVPFYRTLPYFQTLSPTIHNDCLGIYSFVGIAIKSSKSAEVLGTLQLYNKHPIVKDGYQHFIDRDIKLLYKLVNIIAQALENVRKIETIHTETKEFVNRLTSALIHELRHPVASIFALSEALRTLKANQAIQIAPSVQQIIDRIYIAMEKVDDIVNSMDDAFSIKEIDLKRINIEDTIKLVVNESQKLAKRLDIEVFLHFQSETKQIMADSLKLQRALVNIIHNAIDAMPEGGEIHVRTLSNDGFLTIEVEDTGIGIPTEMKDKIFEPYATTKSPDKGIGIGLVITNNIIKQHRGELNFESQQGKGTVFRIILPRT